MILCLNEKALLKFAVIFYHGVIEFFSLSYTEFFRAKN